MGICNIVTPDCRVESLQAHNGGGGGGYLPHKATHLDLLRAWCWCSEAVGITLHVCRVTDTWRVEWPEFNYIFGSTDIRVSSLLWQSVMRRPLLDSGVNTRTR